NPFLQMPQEINGNASTKYGDYYEMETATGKKIILFGGYWSNGSSAGISYFIGNSSSTYSDNSNCSRLLKTAL
ncbi:MAG: hypothetical protein RR294_06310, partial [Bacilli bacterium]